MSEEQNAPARVGRPPMKAGEAKDALLAVRLTDAELLAIRIEARRVDMSVSEWVRWVCERTLAESGRMERLFDELETAVAPKG